MREFDFLFYAERLKYVAPLLAPLPASIYAGRGYFMNLFENSNPRIDVCVISYYFSLTCITCGKMYNLITCAACGEV